MNISEREYHPRHTHGIDVYHRILTFLIAALKAGKPYREIAADLNATGLATPGGGNWSVGVIKSAIHKLRSPDANPSRLYQAMARLHLMGMLSKEDCQVLMTHPAYTEILL